MVRLHRDRPIQRGDNMYENGKRLNRYARMMLHKRNMKKRYAKQWAYGSGSTDWNTLVIQFRNSHPGTDCLQPNYWKDFYLSGSRQYAKGATNWKLRAKWHNDSSRILLNYNDESDCSRIFGGEYRKYYDYIGTVW